MLRFWMPRMIHSHGVYIRQSVMYKGWGGFIRNNKILNLSSASSSPNTFHFHWYVVHNIMLQCYLTLLSSAQLSTVQLGYFLRNEFSHCHNDGRTSHSNRPLSPCMMNGFVSFHHFLFNSTTPIATHNQAGAHTISPVSLPTTRHQSVLAHLNNTN